MSHRPQNRAADTEREQALERDQAADAAPDLNRNAQGLTANRAGIDRSRDRGSRSTTPPDAVSRVDRGPVHIPLIEADALSGFQPWLRITGPPKIA